MSASRPRRRRPRRTTAAVLGCALAVSGCGSAAGGSGDSAAPAAVPRSDQPTLLMADALHGFLLWPQPAGWMLLLTSDGWGHARNVTPPAVPTTGGISLARSGSDLVAASLPTVRLTVSPYLSSADGSAHWAPGELPGAVSPARGAVALYPGSTPAVTAVISGSNDSLVRRTPTGWATLATAAGLAPGSDLRLDAITWADSAHGWLTGHAGGSTSVAFGTADGGRTWSALAVAVGATAGATALTPCRVGERWILPLLVGSNGSRLLEVATAGGAAASWTVHSVAPQVDHAVLGCGSDQAWLLAGHADSARLLTSGDGVTWTDGGNAPAGVTTLAPTGAGSGFAAGNAGHVAQLWAVSGNGASFRPQELPAWVASLGGGTSPSD